MVAVQYMTTNEPPPGGIRVLVRGGRDYKDRDAVYAALDLLHEKKTISCIIHGAAQGADTLAGEWAKDRGIPEERYPADWKKLGKSAGPRRNREMLSKSRADGVVAFPGGTGTADMVKISLDAGLKVWRPCR